MIKAIKKPFRMWKGLRKLTKLTIKKRGSYVGVHPIFERRVAALQRL